MRLTSTRKSQETDDCNEKDIPRQDLDSPREERLHSRGKDALGYIVSVAILETYS
jgi:hypothetical protein